MTFKNRTALSKILVAVLLIFLFFSPLSKADNIPDILFPATFKSGEILKTYRFWLNYALKNPQSPLSEICLEKAVDLNPMDIDLNENDEKLLLKLLEKTENNPHLKNKAKVLYIDFLLRKGHFRKAEKLSTTTGEIKDWFVCGPFGLYAYSSFYKKFQPEKNPLTEKPSYDGTTGKVIWKKAVISPFNCKFYPFTFIYPDKNVVAYIASEFDSKQKQDAIIEVKGSLSWQAWFNNSEVFARDNIKEYSPNKILFKISLNKGTNLLMFKLFSPDNNPPFSVRLLDTSFKPLKGLSFKKSLPFSRITPNKKNSVTSYDIIPERFKTFCKNLSTEDSAAIYAFIYREKQIPDLALDYAKTAAGKKTSPLTYKYLLSKTFTTSIHLPTEIRSNYKRKILDEILKKDSSYIPALLELSDLEKTDEKLRESLELLQKILNINNECTPAYRKKIDLLVDEKWYPEAQKICHKFLKLFPKNIAANIAYGKVAEYLRKTSTSVKAFETAHENNKSSLILWWININYNISSGNFEAAKKSLAQLLEISNGIPAIHFEATKSYESMSLLEKALDQAEKCCNILPENEKYWHRKGELLYKLGKTRKAISAYEQSLRLNPSQHKLRRLVYRLKRKSYAFWKDYAPDINEAINKSRANLYVGSTVRLIDQTVMRIYEDGSRAETIHQLQKILTRSGVASAAEVNIMGEVLEARTILNNKTYLEPVRVPEKNSFTMPGLRENSFIEYLFLLEHQNRYDYTFHAPCWFFRSPDSNEKFVLTQYIVRAPQNFPLKYAQRNFDNPPKISTKDGIKTYIWTMRNMERVPDEENSPHIREFLPYVEIGGRLSWKKMGLLLRNYYLNRIQPTLELKKLAVKLTEPHHFTRDKVIAIYRYVMDNIDDSRGSNRASIINSRKSGSRILLLMALLRIAGIDADYALIRPDKSYIFEPNWELPQPDIFLSRCVAVTLPENKGMMWLDTRYKSNSTNTLLEDYSGATAFVVSDTSAEFHTLPKVSAESFAYTNYCTINLNNNYEENLFAEGKNIVRGKLSALSKEKLKNSSYKEKLRNFEGRMYKRFNNFTTKTLKIPTLKKPGRPFTETYTANIGRFIAPLQKNLFHMPQPFEKLQIVEDIESNPKERENPYRINRYHVVQDFITVNLNGHYQIKNLPEDLFIKSSYGYYSLKYNLEKDILSIKRKYAFSPAFMPLKDFPEFVMDLRKIRQAEKETIKLEYIR